MDFEHLNSKTLHIKLKLYSYFMRTFLFFNYLSHGTRNEHGIWFKLLF